MYPRTAMPLAGLIVILVAVISICSPTAHSADSVTVRVASIGSSAVERDVARHPRLHPPEGPPESWSRGIRLARSESGITVLVESMAVTGDPPQPDDNDFTRIDTAIQSVALLGDGTEVRLVGVFDWTETNAMASWAAADYAVIAPGGVDNVRIYAQELGDAVVVGPGELPAGGIYYEGFLHLFLGSYHGWTVENLELRGFDWTLAMFYSSTNDFDGVTVRNNFIEMPEDLPGSHTMATGEPWQNIAFHLSFGDNQTIEGNEVVIPGTAAATSPEASACVALQSNTSGGSVYDGLVITDNLIRITGAPGVEPERIYGIWENAHGHTSNIEVSYNIFSNEAAGNDPSLNMQRAFRVTSHSSDTTTVAYHHNLAIGANIGIHWIGDNYTSSPPASVLPVIVEANTLLDNDTGIWVHTDDLAPDPGGEPTKMSKATLRCNRFADNGAGVRSDDAEVFAENNWWGCTDGPGFGDCDTALYSGTEGFLDVDPWLVLGLDVDTPVLDAGGQTTANAWLTFNSNGVDTSAGGTISDGTPVLFDSAGGAMDPSSVETVLGEATSGFTAGNAPGHFGVSATVDFTTIEVPVTVTGDAGLSISLSPELQTLDDGANAELAVTVSNSGPNAAPEVQVVVDFANGLGGIGWICVGAGGGSCSNEGSGDIDDVADLPVGASVTYSAIASLPNPFTGVFSVEGLVNPPDYLTDPEPSDNEASAEIRSVRVFEDGFEGGDVSAWSGTAP